MPANELRLAIAEGSVTVYCFDQNGGGPAQVWLNYKQDFDGVRIGYGATREEAIEDAVDHLLEGVRALRALHAPAEPPDCGGPARPPDFGSS